MVFTRFVGNKDQSVLGRIMWDTVWQFLTTCSERKGNIKHYFMSANSIIPSSKTLPPCLNCILIEMGEMACYQERCPQCGRIPPGRKIPPSKKSKPPAVFKKLVGRKLSGKKSVKSGDIKSDIITTQNGKTYVATKQGAKLSQNSHNGERQGGQHGRWQINNDSMV